MSLSRHYEKHGQVEAYELAVQAQSYSDEVLKRLPQLPPDARVLDMASGTGNEAAQMAAVFGSSTKIFEMDISKQAGGIQRNFVLGDLETQVFAEKSFALIHIKDALLHIKNKNKFFEQTRNMLLDHGLLLVVMQFIPEKKQINMNQYIIIHSSNGKKFFDAPISIFGKSQNSVQQEIDLIKQALREKGYTNFQVSMPYYPSSVESLTGIAQKNGFQRDLGLVPETWTPKKDEKNWFEAERGVLLFKKI